jgi:voltage-gated potassium channel
MSNPLLQLRRPALALIGVIVYGVAGYAVLERWDLLDAFFMTLITISTIGYGEVHPLSIAGRVFTSSLILGGVGIMLWNLGIFAEVLGTGQLAQYRRWKGTEARRREIRDHFIICGYGRMGTQIALEMRDEHTPHVVVDHDPDVLRRLQRHGDHPYVEGDAASEEVLREAGIERARGLISAVDSDERAVYIVLAARALNSELYILARAGRPESIRRLELAGANRVVSPYRMAGHQLVQMALRPNLIDVLDTLLSGGTGVQEVVVDDRCTRLGHTLQEAGLLEPASARILAIRRGAGELHVSPQPALRLEAGDLIVALGSERQLEDLANRVH